jgi:energy-coupling factor transporter ATP-binding protein EcfA2
LTPGKAPADPYLQLQNAGIGLTDENVSERFLKKLEERRRAAAQAGQTDNSAQSAPPGTPTAQTPDVDIPDVDQTLVLSPEKQAIDDAIASINIIDAYNRYSNKTPIPPTQKMEGVKVSCPNPTHVDNNPSAWLNQEKGLWYCEPCGMGGDIWDMAAWYYGYGVPSYKDPKLFRELRTRIATELGFQITRSLTGQTYVSMPPQMPAPVQPTPVQPPAQPQVQEPVQTHVQTPESSVANPTTSTISAEPGALPVAPSITRSIQGIPKNGQMVGREQQPAPQSTSQPAPQPTQQPDPATTQPIVLPTAQILATEADKAELEANKRAPVLDWRNILSEYNSSDTFMHEWMSATTRDTCPEEYHFWTGLMALGFSVGRHRLLFDEPHVVPNLFVCLVGPSGAGKSRAKRHLTTVLEEAMPWDVNNPIPMATKLASQPSSGEMFVKTFEHQITDPADPKKVIGYASVRGYVDYDEMAALITKADRLGSTLKTYLMQAADSPSMITTAALGSGVITAKWPFAQVITTTQNRSIQALLSTGDDNSGFINRWAFGTGRMKERQVFVTQQVDLGHAGRLLKDIWQWSMGNTVHLHLDPDARDEFEDFIRKQVWPDQDKLEDKSAILQRMDLLVKKLLVLLTVNEKLSSVPLRVVRMVQMMYPYILKSYGLVYEAMGHTESAEYQMKIVEVIRRIELKKHKYPTPRDIALSMPSKFRDLKIIRDNLKLMTEMGLIIEIAPEAGQRGRPGVRYAVA